MKNLYFQILPKLKVCLTSTSDLCFNEKDLLLAQAYVPGLNTKNTKSKKTDITIGHTESNKKLFSCKNGKIKIYDKWGGKIPLDFWHLLYSVCRIQFLKKELYPIHAACVGKNNYILIVGHSGHGKTTILLKLLEKHGFYLFSGNKTVIKFNKKSILAIAGTSTITTKTENAKQKIKLTNYCGRSALFLDKKHFETKPQVKIKTIVIVRLNDGVKENKKINIPSSTHTLYPYFLDVVNADTIISNRVFIGTPPKGSSEKLASKLNLALAKIPVYQITGSLPFITQEITKL